MTDTTAMKRWMAILSTVLVPSSVYAQETVRGWPGLKPSGLPTVYVVDEMGVETAGRLLRLDPDSLVLLVDGTERHFEAVRVRRIERQGDSLRNGALFGAVIGTLAGLAVIIADCPGDDPGGSCPGTRAAGFFYIVGVTTAICTAIDALVPGRTTLYVAPTAPPSAAREGSTPSYRVRPGITLSFTW